MYRGHSRQRNLTYWGTPFFSLLLCIAVVAACAESSGHFERSYPMNRAGHITVSNVNGKIHISAWDRRSILARATTAPSVKVDDEVVGDNIKIWTKPNIRLGRADFEISVPAETSVTVKNYVGDIEISGITGHVTVTSIDSDVHLSRVTSAIVDVRVTSGDVFFDGELSEGGSYSLQTMKGDVDVTLPAATPFNLNARALSENINLGSFLSNLTGSNRGPKGVSGSYLRGGPRLTLTTYAGRILLHKK